MKKFIAIAALICTSFALHAQATQDKQGSYSTYTSALDTNTNATTSYVYFKGVGVGGQILSVQFTVTKISGTVGGTVILDASDDYIGWFATGDTLTLSNQATNTQGWQYTGTNHKHFRARFTSTGTQSSSLLATLFKKEDSPKSSL